MRIQSDKDLTVYKLAYKLAMDILELGGMIRKPESFLPADHVTSDV
jgi:hypothetical protein